LTEGRITSFLTETGLFEETIDLLAGIYRFTKSLYRSVPVDITYEAAGMKVGPLEMIHLPGHCPGHVAMRLDHIVLCGDMVVEGVTPHLNPTSMSPHSGVSLYLESLQKLLSWSKDGRLILKGHDSAITNLSEQVDATHKNLTRRMCKAMEALRDSRTTVEIAEAVYGNMDGYHKLLVLEKTGAYIEYFLEHHMIEITNSEKPIKFRRLREYSNDELLLIHVHKSVSAA
jgi:glyoxylase-like metal-dependent hydrolase (beta-lactamase superfamily II)